MDRKEAFAVVVEALAQFADDGTRITGASKPIGDLELDSEDGIAWVCDMDSSGFDIPPNINPFVDKEVRKARTVDEIVDLLLKYAK